MVADKFTISDYKDNLLSITIHCPGCDEIQNAIREKVPGQKHIVCRRCKRRIYFRIYTDQIELLRWR